MTEPPSSAGSFHFGDFHLVPPPHYLTRDDRPITLQPQPGRLLTLLVQRRGEIVTREEIRRELWPDDTYLDHEQAINFAIRKIRVALGDDAKSPRFIETLPRVGYRFLAPIEPAGKEEQVRRFSRRAAPARSPSVRRWCRAQLPGSPARSPSTTRCRVSHPTRSASPTMPFSVASELDGR